MLVLLVYSLYLGLSVTKSQLVDTILNKRKSEIFSSGFIEIMNNGQVNASARFVKLYIGEQGKLCFPVSFYGGVSNNSFEQQTPALAKSNDHLVNQYINPLSGLMNISVEDIKYFSKSKRITKTGIIYRLGERVLNGVRTGEIDDPQTGKPTTFLNSFAFGGLLFQTSAWENTNTQNIGNFWCAVRYHLCYSNPKSIKEFLPKIKTNGIYTGYSLGLGIEIDKLINIKIIYYKYTKLPEIDFSMPIYQFTFNYTVNNNN